MGNQLKLLRFSPYYKIVGGDTKNGIDRGT